MGQIIIKNIGERESGYNLFAKMSTVTAEGHYNLTSIEGALGNWATMLKLFFRTCFVLVRGSVYERITTYEVRRHYMSY